MIEGYSSDELRSIATGGGSVDIDGRSFSAADLRSIATGLRSGAFLIVSNANSFSAAELRSIATGATAGATVLFR